MSRAKARPSSSPSRRGGRPTGDDDGSGHARPVDGTEPPSQSLLHVAVNVVRIARRWPHAMSVPPLSLAAIRQPAFLYGADGTDRGGERPGRGARRPTPCRPHARRGGRPLRRAVTGRHPALRARDARRASPRRRGGGRRPARGHGRGRPDRERPGHGVSDTGRTARPSARSSSGRTSRPSRRRLPSRPVSASSPIPAARSSNNRERSSEPERGAAGHRGGTAAEQRRAPGGRASPARERGAVPLPRRERAVGPDAVRCRHAGGLPQRTGRTVHRDTRERVHRQDQP